MALGAGLLYVLLITTAGVLHAQSLISIFNQSYIFSYEVEAYKAMAHIFTYFLMIFMPVHLLYFFNVKLLKVRDLTRITIVLIFIQVLSGFLYPLSVSFCLLVKFLSGVSLIISMTYLHILVYKNLPRMFPE
ncbi:MAG: hypothetical protein MK008_06580 [Bdellovibrionales bacterium]|nr:hypothetical protein [Bdellovibrionales bacterium]